MVSRKHGKIIKYTDVFEEKKSKHHPPKIQIALKEDGKEDVHIINPISTNESKWGFTLHVISYEAIKVILRELVRINGKSEVEKELGIKIKEED